MGTKATGIGCYDKAGKDEELFVLRAQDESSPEIVMEWIKRNFKTASDAKLRDAFDCALRMKHFGMARAAT